MMKNTILAIALFVGSALAINAQQSAVNQNNNTPDTLRNNDIEEVVVIATPKETGKLKKQPAAVSIVSQKDMQRTGITSLKHVSNFVPNLFIPDYGSRITSAVYIRGIGSRINTPAVGLYVDNVPYYDKSAFDFNFYDIERIDVLRGPQGTLYGRNSMGGLVSIHTRSPFTYQGTNVNLGIATQDAHRRASLTHYHRISDQFAFSAGGYYEGSNGYFKNAFTGKRQDKLESGGGRIRAIFKPTTKLSFDFNLGYDYTHEGGYPYYYMGQLNGEETHAENIGTICNNEKQSYTRGMLNSGLNIEYKGKGFVFNAVTGFQHLEDKMFMDQDFLPDSIYTLGQNQKLSILSEELTIKSSGKRIWQWVNGISTAKQWLRTDSPVNFLSGGVSMLENNINSNLPDMSKMGMSMNIGINNDNLLMGGVFQSPTTNLAAFHQSTINISPKWSATIGLRLDYEHNSLSYNYAGNINYDFKLQSSRMPLSLKGIEANPSSQGKIRNDYFEVLPKVAVKYTPSNKISFYASAAKGHRSGGYNVQMFSELLQSEMRNQMMSGIKEGVNATLDRFAQMGMPQNIIQMISAGLDKMPVGQDVDVSNTVTYKPEFSWNYEVGTRMNLLDNRLQLDMALFLTTVRNQQIARFAQSGLGRMMANAGRSRSCGLEVGMKYNFSNNLTAWANYGYTYAKFTSYDAGDGYDYTGNKVPFIPRNTLSFGADYKIVEPKTGALKSLTIGMNGQGAGRIYWTEANNASQGFYTVFGAHALADFGSVQLNIWGKNIFARQYNTFYFESMNRAYTQHCKPIQFGMDISLKF